MAPAVIVAWGCLLAGAAARDAPLAVVNVAVVDVERSRVVAGQTVVARAGTIVSVGPSATAVIPAGTRVVDGSGLFALPGLFDAHVHLTARPRTRG